MIYFLYSVSGASGAPLSANLVTPRQHLRRLTNVRRQIVTETAASSSKSGDSTPTNLTSPAAQGMPDSPGSFFWSGLI